MIVAVVPAAGKSQRMGQSKLLMPLGPRRVIEHVLSALDHSPIDRVFVVLPPGAVELAAAIRPFRKARVVDLVLQTPDMRASVQAGLDAAVSEIRPAPQAFLLALADQPTISPPVIRCLVERFLNCPSKIVIPTFHAKRGHPVLFSWQLVDAIRAMPGDQGINQLVDRLAPDVDECPIDDERVLLDLDTPDDYENLRRIWTDEL